MAGDNVCHVCGATFTRPQHVGRHMRSHTGDKPYHCKECPEKFARSDLLSRHVNKTHGPAEGEDGKGNGRNVVANKTKGRKPKFKSAAESLSSALGPGYVPPFSNLPQAPTRFQQPQYADGQQLSYNLQAPFPDQSFQPPPQYGYVQTGHNLETVPNPTAMATPSSAGMPMGTRRDQTGAIYTVLGENGRASGYEVETDDDASAWIDIPHNPQAAGMMSGHRYAMPQPFNTMAPSYSQIATQLPAQLPPPPTSMIASPYAQPFDGSLAVQQMSSTGNADNLLSSAFSTGYSPAMMTMQAPNASNATADSSPYSFWSGSNTQSSPSNSGQPGYQQPMHRGASGGPILSSSTSPYSFNDPTLPRQSSDSPALAGLDIMHTKGNSPLAPAPAGMTSLGAIPTTYSSIMPAPLVPTGTPLADQVEKIKKRACESCNHSKVKCDFQIPCGKCASRKIACVYPTGRKSSRKANMSGSPLSQGAADGSKPNSISPAISNVDFKPVIFSSQTAQNQPLSAFAHNGLSAAQSSFQQQQANGHLGGSFGPQQVSYMAGPADPQATTQLMNGRADQFHPLGGDAMAFAQTRQAADEDGESTTSGYTYGQASIPDSRRSSLAAPFESSDDQQVNSTLPLGNLSLGGPFLAQNGSVAPNVQQWLAHPSGIGSGMDQPVGDVSPTTATFQNGFPNVFPRTMAAAPNVFWQNGMQPGATLAHAPRSDLLTRPALMRGRSNSFPSVFTPRGDIDVKQYFAPLAKDFAAPSGDQSALPSDWTAQIKHLTTQLNRNGSGSSSLQQVDDTLASTSQSSPQANGASPEVLFSTAHSGIASASYNQNRPTPAVLQSAIPNAMSQQFMAGRGSLQTLAPERTASFLNSTPSVELDGMGWQSASTSKKPAGVLQSPFKMPNHLARPGNKRLASQTLGPDAQKRLSISSTEYDLAGHSNMLDASANQVMGLLAPRPGMYRAPSSGRRASIPSWLPDNSGSQGLMQSGGPNTGTSLAFPHMSLQGGNSMNYSPGVPSFFFAGLTPTISDTMQGFNFNSSIDLTTPTVERVAFNTQTDDGKPGSAWPIQA